MASFTRGRVLLSDALHINQFCNQEFIGRLGHFGLLTEVDVLLGPKSMIVVEVQEKVWHAG